MPNKIILRKLILFFKEKNMTYSTFLIRISMSFLLSLLIGLERQLRGRAIGLRTNVLVSIGSFLFVSFSFLSVNGDMGRIAAQVVSGIGFLGAGVIIKDGLNIRGLNTAATMWCDAAIGVLCAGGFLVEAGIGSFLILFANIVLRFLTHKFSHKQLKRHCYELNILCHDSDEASVKNLLTKVINKNEITLTNIASKEEKGNKEISVSVFTSNMHNYMIDNLIGRLTVDPKIISLTINRSEQRQNILDDDE